jgi:hypothetical protein
MRLKYAQRYYSLEVNRELLQHFSSDSYKCVADKKKSKTSATTVWR